MTQHRPFITLIAAVSENQVIGSNNQLPWLIPEDMTFFRNTTMNHPVIMGKNTWLSIGKVLDGRKNIVLSHTLKQCEYPDIIVYSDMNALFDEIQSEQRVFVIGGQSIYQQMMSVADALLITKIHHTYHGDAFFPEISERIWQKAESIKGQSADFAYPFSFDRYQRKIEVDSQ